MLRILSLIVALLLTLPAPGQKQLKPIRASLKARNANEAMKAVEAGEKDSTLQLLPQLYEYGKQAQILINDEQNEKIYLKQSYDTVRFFASTQGIYDYILKCRKAELNQLALHGDKPRFSKSNTRLLHKYYNNLGAAGRFFFARNKYDDAFRYLSTYLTVPQDELWGAEKDILTSPDYYENAYLYLCSAYRTKRYAEVETYADMLLADTVYRLSVMEQCALAAIGRGDTAAYKNYLQDGLTHYPKQMFFFTHLADLYALQGHYDTVILMTDSLLKTDSTNLFYLEAKCVSHLNLKQYEDCIRTACQSLDIDPTLIDTYYYVGAAYCSMADDIALPVSINSRAYRRAQAEQRDLFTKARPYLEVYRRRAPEDEALWAPLLYRIYFHLNEGPLFDEMERILKKKK